MKYLGKIRKALQQFFPRQQVVRSPHPSCHSLSSREWGFWRFFLLSVLIFLLNSCNSYLADGVRVAWAKQLFQQGDYQEALRYFIDAEQGRRLYRSKKTYNSTSNISATKRIQYNIGLIYSALGESHAAANRWQAILDQGGLQADKKLQLMILYNLGILYGQAGDYQRARRSLVQALNIDPEYNDARIALELCLKRLKQREFGGESQQEEQELKEDLPTESGTRDEKILNYISQRANYRFQRDAKVQQVLHNDW